MSKKSRMHSRIDRVHIMQFLELLRDIEVISHIYVITQLGIMCTDDSGFAEEWFNV